MKTTTKYVLLLTILFSSSFVLSQSRSPLVQIQKIAIDNNSNLTEPYVIPFGKSIHNLPIISKKLPHFFKKCAFPLGKILCAFI